MIEIIHINQTAMKDAIAGTDFEIVSSVVQHPAFLIPIIALIAINLIWFLLMGLVLGNKNRKMITYPNYWYLFIGILLQIIVLLFMLIFPLQYMWL